MLAKILGQPFCQICLYETIAAYLSESENIEKPNTILIILRKVLTLILYKQL
jgi:hypothetical protein